MEELSAGGLRRKLRSSAAYQGGPVRFSKTFVALPSVVARR